jgi:hypothetical protein
MEKNKHPLRKVLTGLIYVYQKAISPWFPAKCRYYPSCSEYAVEAIESHGSLKGAWLSIKRILKCHPFSEGGFDPVPNPTNNQLDKSDKKEN